MTVRCVTALWIADLHRQHRHSPRLYGHRENTVLPLRFIKAAQNAKQAGEQDFAACITTGDSSYDRCWLRDCGGCCRDNARNVLRPSPSSRPLNYAMNAEITIKRHRQSG
jgi:hypothetical protein